MNGRGSGHLEPVSWFKLIIHWNPTIPLVTWEDAPSVKSHWCIYNRRLFICWLYIPDSLGLMTDHHESVSVPGNYLRFDYPPLTFSVIPGQRWATGHRTFQWGTLNLNQFLQAASMHRCQVYTVIMGWPRLMMETIIKDLHIQEKFW